MRIFTCPACAADLYFDNLACACGLSVAYDAQTQRFVGDLPFCANRRAIRCNWIGLDDGDLCASCKMTTVHPDLAVVGNDLLWSKAEHAKRWVLVGLLRWGWLQEEDTGPRPEFHMLAESTSSGSADVTMGHASGLVTINLAEADAIERVRRRQELGEPYRTMIGHFRHELAHFLFERLVVSEAFVSGFRALFGDETKDYGEALARHYASGPPANWRDAYITGYASAHAHEDWAESTAHALHMTDIVDSFLAAGLRVGNLPGEDYDAYVEKDTARLFGFGIDIGLSLNHVNRSMGLSDLYPFVNPPKVQEKLSFAHRWLKSGATI